MLKSIPCMLFRGGTSKGAFFLDADLPADPAEREHALLRIMGSPDKRQIDGVGGADTLTSKVAMISKSTRPVCGFSTAPNRLIQRSLRCAMRRRS